MVRNDDGSVTLAEEELKSLAKMVSACSYAISGLSSDGDFLGWDNFWALGMWEDKLKGDRHELKYYIDEVSKRRRKRTVDEWLSSYGRTFKG